MKYFVRINKIMTIDDLEGSWSNEELKELLNRFDYADADKLKPTELKEYLFMAITDFEPNEAAAILLDYKLSEVLAEGQIGNISHEMLREKVSENYSDIYIHHELFKINQLLYKAYNGKFPSSKATVVEFEMKATEQGDETEISKELVLKALGAGLSDGNLIKRLFGDQLAGTSAFQEAEGIIWELKKKGNDQFRITTSEKWLTKEEFKTEEFECTISPFVENVEKA